MKLVINLEIYEENTYDPPDVQVEIFPGYNQSMLLIHDGHGPDGGPSRYMINTGDLQLLAHILKGLS